MLDLSFVDDLTLVLLSTTPQGLVDTVATVVNKARELFGLMGFSFGFGCDKSAAIIALRGRGPPSDATRQTHSRSPPSVQLDADTCLTVVKDHLQVGSVITATGAMRQEVRRRIKRTAAQIGELKAPLLSVRSIGGRAKVFVANAVFSSSLLRAACVWNDLSKGSLIKRISKTSSRKCFASSSESRGKPGERPTMMFGSAPGCLLSRSVLLRLDSRSCHAWRSMPLFRWSLFCRPPKEPRVDGPRV